MQFLSWLKGLGLDSHGRAGWFRSAAGKEATNMLHHAGPGPALLSPSGQNLPFTLTSEPWHRFQGAAFQELADLHLEGWELLEHWKAVLVVLRVSPIPTVGRWRRKRGSRQIRPQWTGSLKAVGRDLPLAMWFKNLSVYVSSCLPVSVSVWLGVLFDQLVQSWARTLYFRQWPKGSLLLDSGVAMTTVLWELKA